MKNKNVKFKGYSVSNFNLEENVEKDGNVEKEDTGNLEVSTKSLQNKKDSDVYKVCIRVKTVTKKSILVLELEGIFEFENIIEKEVIDEFLKITAPTILYPYCRSFISLVTGFDSDNVVLLPIINFANTN